MPSPRIPTELKDEIYFVTFTVKNWYYIFDRHHRFEILEDSFIYCQEYKGLKIYAFVFMLNHLHFIGQSPNLIAVIRDMKKYLSKQLQANIIATEPNILTLFKVKDKNEYHFWKPGNYPELIQSYKFLQQKQDYIHNNPVRKNYVHYAEDWKYSSASKIQTRIQLTTVD